VKPAQSPRLFLILFALLMISSPAAALQESTTSYDEITEEVANMRGLEILSPIEVTPKSREQLGQELKEDLDADYPVDERIADERELIAFGLMDPDVDLGQLIVDLYTEQVAGYYDPATGEMVVIRNPASAEELTPSEHVTYAHEVVHALQDQHFDIDAGALSREETSDDESLAITALIEGDASFSEVSYLLDRPELLDHYLTEITATEFDTATLDSAPPIISSTLLFPYDNGYTFVQALYGEGGWDTVNSAFVNPPQSTEQILHPEKYLAGEAPVEIEVPNFTSLLGEDWEVFDNNTFGEYQIRIILEQSSMPKEQAIEAAAGWGGDTYVVAGTDDQDAIHWISSWDTEEDAIEFAKALATYESSRWNIAPTYAADTVIKFEADGVVTQITLDGDAVTYIKAPDVETLNTIASGEGTSFASPEATPAKATPAP